MARPAIASRFDVRAHYHNQLAFRTSLKPGNGQKSVRGAVLEGRHPSTAAKRHTVGDLIDRYMSDVLPGKRASTVYNQRYQLRWWKAQRGHYVLADVTPALLIEYRDKRVRNQQFPGER